MGKILIVEDEKEIRDMLVRMATQVDPSVVVKSTGYACEALEYAKYNHVDAFFFDIQLIDYTGLELAKEIREIERYGFTPIVFITAMPTRELEAFKQIHCYDYIIKPFKDEEVVSVFRKILIDYSAFRGKESSEKLSLEFQNYTQLIDLKEVLYVEYANRRVVIHTKKETIRYNRTPLKLFKELLPDYFIQVHQSVVVNSKYVNKIDLGNQSLQLEEVIEAIPIGRSFIKDVGGRLNQCR